MMPSHFLTLDADALDTARSKEWFRHCKGTSRPYITILAGKNLATLDWDSITLPDSLYDIVASKEEELIAGFRGLADKYGNKRTERWVGAGSAHFTNIAIGQAEGFAEALFELVTGTLGLKH